MAVLRAGAQWWVWRAALKHEMARVLTESVSCFFLSSSFIYLFRRTFSVSRRKLHKIIREIRAFCTWEIKNMCLQNTRPVTLQIMLCDFLLLPESVRQSVYPLHESEIWFRSSSLPSSSFAHNRTSSKQADLLSDAASDYAGLLPPQ